MDYDSWKLATPDDDDRISCLHCGDSIADDKSFCSRGCMIAFDND